MFDLKKTLLDLADDIKYKDMYDLTEVPKVLKKASEKIGYLELTIIGLLERIEEYKQEQPLSAPRTSLDRLRIKSQLEDLGVEYSNKANTQRLFRKLQKALKG